MSYHSVVGNQHISCFNSPTLSDIIAYNSIIISILNPTEKKNSFLRGGGGQSTEGWGREIQPLHANIAKSKSFISKTKRVFLSILIFILLILSSSKCYANWNKSDTIREVVWQGIHVIDWGQTLEVARHPEKYHELNPILGRHPSVGRVNVYMGLSAVGHIVISYILPEKARSYWQYVSIGVSGACVVNNFNIGLGIKF